MNWKSYEYAANRLMLTVRTVDPHPLVLQTYVNSFPKLCLQTRDYEAAVLEGPLETAMMGGKGYAQKGYAQKGSRLAR